MSPFNVRFQVTALSMTEEIGLPGSYRVTLQEMSNGQGYAPPNDPLDARAMKMVASPPTTRVEYVSRQDLLQMSVGDEYELTPVATLKVAAAPESNMAGRALKAVR